MAKKPLKSSNSRISAEPKAEDCYPFLGPPWLSPRPHPRF
uniref:Uncharacterized protein n=1 Tax=Rhizophora mucronata TaxID=61149 RepID=A0A2P2KKY8_RHIMU